MVVVVVVVLFDRCYKQVEVVLKKMPEKSKPSVNIVIPMAGAGSRFAKAGYKDPKPLIPVRGKAMIQVVVDNMRLPGAHFIFVVQRSHYDAYNLGKVLGAAAPGCDIIQIDGITDGAACTVLKAQALIDNDVPMLMANSDQFLEWDARAFAAPILEPASNSIVPDGIISTFVKHDPDTKWSYAKLDSDAKYVTRVEEKVPISNNASTGIYMWRRGSDFVKYANQMIAANDRSNNEFYVCPVYNYAIKDGKKITVDHCTRMWGIGVPDDLEFFLKNYQGQC